MNLANSRHKSDTQYNNIYEDLKITPTKKKWVNNTTVSKRTCCECDFAGRYPPARDVISHTFFQTAVPQAGHDFANSFLLHIRHYDVGVAQMREHCEDMLGAMRTISWGHHVEQGPCNLGEILGESVKQMLNIIQESVSIDYRGTLSCNLQL